MEKELVTKLQTFMKIIIDEASKNKDFSERLQFFFYNDDVSNKTYCPETSERPKNRRDKAVLDPIKLLMDNDTTLRQQLEKLSEKELKDIIAEYGMDQAKLAMKWKDKNRLIQLILDTASRRAAKGDAFRM